MIFVFVVVKTKPLDKILIDVSCSSAFDKLANKTDDKNMESKINQIEKDYVKNNPPKSTVAQDLEQSASKDQGLAMLARHPMQAEAPQSQGVAGLDTGNMFNEQSYATGGIVAFANNEDQPVSRNMPDEYGIVMPPGATLDDISMEMQAANKLYGVDPDFYKTQAAELQRQRDELAADKTQAGWMGLARAGLGMAAGKSPYALSNIGEGIAGGVKDYAEAEKAERAEKKLLLQYQTALDQADYAKKMGNFTALEQIQGRLAGLKVAAINANATKQAALDAAHQKNFGELVARLMRDSGMTEDQAIAAASKIYLQGSTKNPEGVTVTQVKKS